MRSPQPSPVHLEVTYEISGVVPAQSGAEEQVGGRRGPSTLQPHHIINAQALNPVLRHLQAGYVEDLVERDDESGRTSNFTTCM